MSDAYARLVAAAEADERIVGLLLGGSRGKGQGTERSDHDVYVVVADDVDPADLDLTVDYGRDSIDLAGAWTVADFAAYAIGDGNDWNRYTFAHLRPPVDKLGVLQGLCDAKEWLPEREAEAQAALLLDGYLNYRYRAAKNRRDGNLDAAGLDVAESVLMLLDFVFTSERRVRPYNKFLAWELQTHPLAQDWGVATDAATLREVLRTADPGLQATCFRAVERVARRLGYDAVVDGWRPAELALMASSEV